MQSLEGGKLVKVPDWTMQADECSACVAYKRNNEYVAGCVREKNQKLLNVMPSTACTSDDELSCHDDYCCCKSEACFDTRRERLGNADISGQTCTVGRKEGSVKRGTFLRQSCASCQTRNDKSGYGVEKFCEEKSPGGSIAATASLVALSLLSML